MRNDHSRLVVATSQGPRIYSRRGREFTLDQQVAIGGAARVAVADLNRDGVADLAVARASEQRRWDIPSRVLWGRGAAGRETYSPDRGVDLPTLGAVDVAAGDLDGDGFTDLVFANSRSYESYDVPSYVYWGGAGGPWTS